MPTKVETRLNLCLHLERGVLGSYQTKDAFQRWSCEPILAYLIQGPSRTTAGHNFPGLPRPGGKEAWKDYN